MIMNYPQKQYELTKCPTFLLLFSISSIVHLHHHVILVQDNHYIMTKVCLFYHKNPNNSFYLDKLGSNNRLDRESYLKSSPTNDRRVSPENPTRQSNTSLRKTPIASKQSLKTIHDDDEF